MAAQQDDVESLGRLVLRVLELPGTASAWRSWNDTEFWQVSFGSQTALGSCSVFADGAPSEMVRQMLDGLTNDVSETTDHRGEAFPRCPGHRHPARYEVLDDAVVLTCPTTGAGISRTELPA